MIRSESTVGDILEFDNLLSKLQHQDSNFANNKKVF